MTFRIFGERAYLWLYKNSLAIITGNDLPVLNKVGAAANPLRLGPVMRVVGTLPPENQAP